MKYNKTKKSKTIKKRNRKNKNHISRKIMSGGGNICNLFETENKSIKQLGPQLSIASSLIAALPSKAAEKASTASPLAEKASAEKASAEKASAASRQLAEKASAEKASAEKASAETQSAARKSTAKAEAKTSAEKASRPSASRPSTRPSSKPSAKPSINIPNFNNTIPTGTDFDTTKKEHVVNFVIQHQKNRFQELEYILDNTNAKAIIAGFPDSQMHALGVGLAKEQWERWGDMKKNRKHWKKMQDNLKILFDGIIQKYKDKGRVTVGAIGLSTKTNIDPKTGNNLCNEDLTKNPSEKIIHVWGANEGNWNLDNNEEIEGGGQILCLDKQIPGIFGIVTTVHHKIPNSINDLFTDTTDKIQEYLDAK